MSGMGDFLKHPAVASQITPEIRDFLEANQPPEITSPEHQVGHWVGVTICVLKELAKLRDAE